MTRRLLALTLVLLLLATPLPAIAHPEGPGHAHPDARPAQSVQDGDIPLVGALRLGQSDEVQFGDVASYKDLAFIGKIGLTCTGAGVDIIDISNPAAPVKLAETPGQPQTAFEDMQAIRIGTRDVLAIGLQICGREGRSGFELVDITDPRQPQRLSLFDLPRALPRSDQVPGVHEFDLTTTPDGRVVALLAVPYLEAATTSGDLLILDITDPTTPVLVGEWGLLGEPALGPDVSRNAERGVDRTTFLHSVRAMRGGTQAFLSYWDAGVIALDIADPARPVFLGRTAFAPGDEGNAHSVAFAQGGAVLVQADEDWSPFALQFSVTAPGALVQSYPALEGEFTRLIATLPGKALTGDLAHVGRGCPPGTPNAPADGDPYLADPAGKIALIERGVCPYDHKVARAQQAGAVGVIVYNSASGPRSGDTVLPMGGANPVAAGPPSVRGTRITIPGIFVGRGTGVALTDALAAGQSVAVNAGSVFTGWGYLRLFDIANPATPIPLGTFATTNTNNEAVSLADTLSDVLEMQGPWSAHNPEVRGTILYASWYRDGVRAIDLARPSAPREVGFWRGAGAPAGAPPVNIWGVVSHNDLLLLSDMSYGLYILRAGPAPGVTASMPNTGGGMAPRTGAARAPLLGLGLVALLTLVPALARRPLATRARC